MGGFKRRHGLIGSGPLGLTLLVGAACLTPLGQGIASEDEMTGFSFPEARCGESFVLTKEIVRAATRADVYGYDGEPWPELPAFLTGTLPTGATSGGAVLFVKREGRWTGIAGEESHGFEGVFTAPDKGRVVLFTSWAVEGPGQDYTLMRTEDGFANVSCSSLDFPDEIEQPANSMLLVDFNIDKRDEGALIGRTDFAWEGPAHWYRYVTKDGGKTWSAPEVLTEEPAELSGIFSAADESGFCDLKSELMNSLR